MNVAARRARALRLAPMMMLALLLLLPAPFAARAQAPVAGVVDETSSPAYIAAQNRWRNELAAFARSDRENPPPADGVLFIGSSTIRFWTRLAQDFPQLPVVINRGFGGSTMTDCSLFVRELVLRHRPRHVLVYAGDNDLAEGHDPLQILESFARFANAVRAELPNTRISYISIKPSPSREKFMPRMRETNDIIAAYLRRLPNSDYIDVYSPMLAADGRPRGELFRADRLHLNDEGYRLWRDVIGVRLRETTDHASTVGALPLRPAMPLGADSGDQRLGR